MSGANASMSGHMTTISRGSRVGSAARRWRMASRTTSTWRPGPWQAWTARLVSPGRARPGRHAPPAGGRVVVGHRARRPGSVAGGSPPPPRSGGDGRTGRRRRRRRPPSGPAASPGRSPQVSRELAGTAAVGSTTGERPPPPPVCSSTRCHSTGDGWRRKRCTSRWTASACSTARKLAGSRVSRTARGGKAGRRWPRPPEGDTGVVEPLGRAGDADVTRSLRHSSACHAHCGDRTRPAPSTSSLAAQARSMPGRCTP